MDPLSEILLHWGYLGLFIGASLPLSADLLIIGLLAVGGDPVICILSATAGNWLGSLLAYWLGSMGKWEWISKYLKVKESSMEKYHSVISKYGAWFGLATGVPFIGDIVAVSIGFFKVRVWRAAPFMLIGKLLRFVIVTLLVMGVRPMFG